MYINKAEANILATVLNETKRKIAQQTATYMDNVEPILDKLTELETRLRNYSYDEKLISASDFPFIVKRYCGLISSSKK